MIINDHYISLFRVQYGMVAAAIEHSPLATTNKMYNPLPLNQFIACTPIIPSKITPNRPDKDPTAMALARYLVSYISVV